MSRVATLKSIVFVLKTTKTKIQKHIWKLEMMKCKKIDTFMDLSETNLSHNPAVREIQQNSKDFKIKIAVTRTKIIVNYLNPFEFSHCQQLPPLFSRRDSLTSYHLCNTRPMANVRLKVQWFRKIR